MTNDRGVRHTVLVVDDEPVNINVLNEVLKPDYQVLFATGGEQALELLGSRTVDLILLDIVMPGMNGLEVCRRIKAENRTSSIPVIFVTAMTQDEDEARGLESGAIDYITKPFSPPIVKARVRNHLELAVARSELERKNLELIEAAKLREDVEHITRHDLKSPLSSIIGFSGIILEDYENREDNITCLETIRDSGYRMLEMINRSLDMFKLERGTYELHPLPFDPIRIMTNVIRDNSQLAKSLNAQVLFEQHSCGVIKLLGEELLFYSMLSNVVRNALEASPSGGKVSIQCEHDEKFGIVSITNSGNLAVEVRERFFEKLFSFGKQDGTGLGTYSAKLIAEALGGNITLDTPQDKFVRVSVRIPLA
jgi:two-component system, sensor histidine kinase and response regulator